jgi:GDP-L-galactose phosphorylase
LFPQVNLLHVCFIPKQILFQLPSNGNMWISNLWLKVKNLVTGCSLSTWECGGYFIYHTKFEFDNASETEISKRMASVSLQDSAFEDLKHLCCAIAHDLVK